MGRTRTRDKHLPRGVYFKHGAYWLVRYKDRKKHWTRLGKTEAQAWAELSRIRAGDGTGLTVDALVERYTFEELPRKAVSGHRAERSQMRQLVKAFGRMRPDDITPPDVWEYWHKRGEGPAARHEVKQLSVLMSFARRIGALKGLNPCTGLKFPGQKPRTRYVTDTEFLAVQSLAPPMVRHAMNLALLCGMDRSTVLALERRHLTEDGIAFRRGKTDQEQLIRWTDDLHQVVDAILREPPRLRAALICAHGGKPYTADGFGAAWRRTMKRATQAGIPHFRFHDLRAKSASDAASDQLAADRLGHSDVRLTRRVYRRLPRVADPASLPARIVDKTRE